MELDAKIEAILFWKGEAVSIVELARMLKTPSGEIKRALKTLDEKLQSRGISLVRTDTDNALVTAKDASSLISDLQKEELSRELGKAALETLSLVLYRSPVSRREIEYVRGVNSTAILRSLLIRGLIERIPDANDVRGYRYCPTISLLSLLGIKDISALPEYETVKSEIEAWNAEQKKTEENLVEPEPEMLDPQTSTVQENP